MAVKAVPTLGWTRSTVAATILFVTQQQRDEIAARVRAEMKRQGFTNSKLARDADLSEKTISRLINARKDSRIDTLERVGNVLAVDLLGTAGRDATQLDRIEARVNDLHALFCGGAAGEGGSGVPSIPPDGSPPPLATEQLVNLGEGDAREHA